MSIWSRLFGPKLKNTERTSKAEILRQMHEPRPLPMGLTEFNEWADRIISGALIPTDNVASQKLVLSKMLMALGPTEDHKPDAYFIHMLRKAATNEVAMHVLTEAQNKSKAKAAPKSDAG